jgi:hypothetical protein
MASWTSPCINDQAARARHMMPTNSSNFANLVMNRNCLTASSDLSTVIELTYSGLRSAVEDSDKDASSCSKIYEHTANHRRHGATFL